MKPQRLNEVMSTFSTDRPYSYGENSDFWTRLRNDQSLSDIGETRTGLIFVGANFDRSIADGLIYGANNASAELLRICKATVIEQQHIASFRIPPITVGRGNIADFGERLVKAQLSAIVRRDEDGKFHHPWDYAYNHMERTRVNKYRIWVGIAYQGPDDPVRQHFHKTRPGENNLLDIQEFSLPDDHNGGGMYDDYPHWLRFMIDAATVPENIPEAYGLPSDGTSLV